MACKSVSEKVEDTIAHLEEDCYADHVYQTDSLGAATQYRPCTFVPSEQKSYPAEIASALRLSNDCRVKASKNTTLAFIAVAKTLYVWDPKAASQVTARFSFAAEITCVEELTCSNQDLGWCKAGLNRDDSLHLVVFTRSDIRVILVHQAQDGSPVVFAGEAPALPEASGEVEHAIELKSAGRVFFSDGKGEVHELTFSNNRDSPFYRWLGNGIKMQAINQQP